jgi:hypothetical protein
MRKNKQAEKKSEDRESRGQGSVPCEKKKKKKKKKKNVHRDLGIREE